MSRSVVTAALLSGVLFYASAAALADAGGNCGSAASAPGLPGASNESEPRSCNADPIPEPGPAAEPPAVEPPGASEIAQPSSPVDMPDPIPEPPPQQ